MITPSPRHFGRSISSPDSLPNRLPGKLFQQTSSFKSPLKCQVLSEPFLAVPLKMPPPHLFPSNTLSVYTALTTTDIFYALLACVAVSPRLRSKLLVSRKACGTGPCASVSRPVRSSWPGQRRRSPLGPQLPSTSPSQGMGPPVGTPGLPPASPIMSLVWASRCNNYYTPWSERLCPPPSPTTNSYMEILIPKAMVLGYGAFGK